MAFARDVIGGAPLPFLPPPPPVIRDRWFKGETLRIDGYTFERCRFDACKLVTENATFSFKDCFIAADCAVLFAGPALKVARLLAHVLRVKGRVTQLDGEEGPVRPPRS